MRTFSKLKQLFQNVVGSHRDCRKPESAGYDLRAKKWQADCCLSGRSMVEMIGVLAIIGVLSVGAIAGYSHAMYKHKLNLQIQEFNNIVSFLNIEQDKFNNLPDWYYLEKYLIDLKIIEGKYGKPYDKFNNPYSIRKIAPSMFDFALQMSSLQNDSYIKSANIEQNCRDLYLFFIIPNHPIISNAGIYLGVGGSPDGELRDQFYGSQICNNKNYPCLSSLTPSKISSICSQCEESRYCRLYLQIKF